MQQQADIVQWSGNAVARPRLIAGIAAPFAGLEMTAIVMVLMRSFGAAPFSSVMQGITLFLVWAFTSLCAFTVMAFLLGAPVRRRRLRWAGLVMAAFMAATLGVAATLFVFGKVSPFGFALDGISGPLTDGLLTGLLFPMVWPVVFLGAGFGGILCLLRLLPFNEQRAVTTFLANPARR
ncbi:MAG: hypothetical protein AAGK33_09290 [Pseudomonadota bacterium]